ncbi:MAG TPA: DnaJ domain-containing protein [Kofleriaceae bacterium]|nr:DnaJ domain-containing protein [Kofleriaceae bacterium]
MGREADGPWVGDDARVRSALESELARLSRADAFAALGVAAGASAAEIRARFLELVKRYHPTRYARRPREVVRMANEVFLKLKAAYEAAGDSSSAADPSVGRRVTRKSEKLERLSPPSRPKLEVDTALARRRRLRSYPVLPGVAGTQPVETVTPDEMAERVRRRDDEKRERFQAAIADLRAGKLETARETLRALLAETPGDKQVRTYLHYTLGREHHAAGREEAARGEYERALALEPGFEPALKSLSLLAGGDPKDPGDERGGGLISRWFRR